MSSTVYRARDRFRLTNTGVHARQPCGTVEVVDPDGNQPPEQGGQLPLGLIGAAGAGLLLLLLLVG